MEKSQSSCHSIRADSLRWADSEVRSQSPLSFVGDSQFPLSVPVCPDSQDVDIRPVREDSPSLNSFGSSGSLGSFDMKCWDLAEGERKSQSTGNHPGLAHTLLCPPPSLGTQEFETRYMKVDHTSNGKCFQSPGTSSLDEMTCWDLAEGEAISQDAGQPFADAETPICSPASLDSQEFIRRCATEGSIKWSAEDLDVLPSNACKDCHAADSEAGPESPLQALDGDDMPVFPLPPVSGQDVELSFSSPERVSSPDSNFMGLKPVSGPERPQRLISELFGCETKEWLESSAASPGAALGLGLKEKENVQTVNQIASQDAALNDTGIRVPQIHLNTFQKQRIVGVDAEPNKLLLVANVAENVSAAANSEQPEHGAESDIRLPLGRRLKLQAKCLAAVQDEVLASEPAQQIIFPSTTLSPDIDCNVNFHLSKRKSREKSWSFEDDILGTRSQTFKGHLSNGKLSIAINRSPLAPISANLRLSIDRSDEEALISSRQSCELNVLLSEGENMKNTPHTEASELIPSSQQYLFEKSNLEFQQLPKEVRSAAETSPTTELKTKTKTKFDAGDKSPLDFSGPILQPSRKGRVQDGRLKSVTGLNKDKPDKTSSFAVQSRLSSRVGVSSNAASVTKPAPAFESRRYVFSEAGAKMQPQDRRVAGSLKS
ncbi:hypothetical protein R1flu_004577 [Riccia fluitans]|uniref:Uncharacterized protein n=1 Tax=Riccia fluitans TaxID=41844 RepID=A0ABD1YRB8_9MARC